MEEEREPPNKKVSEEHSLNKGGTEVQPTEYGGIRQPTKEKNSDSLRHSFVFLN